MNNLFYDGFNSKLIETAFFEGFLEIPILEAPKEIVIPWLNSDKELNHLSTVSWRFSGAYETPVWFLAGISYQPLLKSFYGGC